MFAIFVLVFRIESSAFRAPGILGFESRRNSSVGRLLFWFAAVLEKVLFEF